MIKQEILDRVLGRTGQQPTREDLDAVCFEAAAFVNLVDPIGPMIGKALAELIERREGRWPDA